MILEKVIPEEAMEEGSKPQDIETILFWAVVTFVVMWDVIQPKLGVVIALLYILNIELQMKKLRRNQ